MAYRANWEAKKMWVVMDVLRDVSGQQKEQGVVPCNGGKWIEDVSRYSPVPDVTPIEP